MQVDVQRRVQGTLKSETVVVQDGVLQRCSGGESSVDVFLEGVDVCNTVEDGTPVVRMNGPSKLEYVMKTEEDAATLVRAIQAAALYAPAYNAKEPLVFTEELRLEAGLPLRMSSWRQRDVLSCLSNDHVSKLKTRLRGNREISVQASCMAMHDEANSVVLGENLGRDRSTVQILDKQGSSHLLSCPTGVTSIDWKQSLLLLGGINGHCFLHTCSPQDTRDNNEAPVAYRSANIELYSSAPGRYIFQDRITCTSLNTSTFLAGRSSTIHLWDIENTTGPIASHEIPSETPVFALEWKPESEHQFLAAGLSSSLKVFDARSLSKSSKAIVWKAIETHTAPIVDVAWSPFLSNWFASASLDGTIKLWDLRRPKIPFRVLHAQGGGCSTVSWSKSHAEVLVSGAKDGSLSLWNLRIGPHFRTCRQENLCSQPGAEIKHVSFSNNPQHLNEYVAVSSESQLLWTQLSPEFEDAFVQHRFEPQYKAEREIESLLYHRNFPLAFRHIAKKTQLLWRDRTSPESRTMLTKLVSLCSKTMFDTFAQSTPKSYTKLIRDLSYFIPSQLLQSSSIPDESNHQLVLIRLRLAIVKLISDNKPRDILSLESDICSHLEQDPGAIDMVTFQDMMRVTLPFDFNASLRFCLKVAEILRDHRRFNDFVPIANLILFPTIYHRLPQVAEATSTHDVALDQKATLTLERDMRNPSIVIPQLELMCSVYTALALPDRGSTKNMGGMSAALEILENKTLLNTGLVLLYFNGLLEARFYDKFFIIATQTAMPLQGYDIHHVLLDLMNCVGWPVLEQYLQSCLEPNSEAPWTTSKYVAVTLTVLNVIENCSFLPQHLHKAMPSVLRLVKSRLQHALQSMCDHPEYEPQYGSGPADARRHAKKVLKHIYTIRELKKSSHIYFEELVADLVTMLHLFDDQFTANAELGLE